MKVLNFKNSNLEDLKKGVYIGRYNSYYGFKDSKYRNIYVIGKDGNGEEVVEKYDKYIRSKYSIEEIKRDLKGKNLICWCFPNYCHGNILKEICENE